MREREATLAPPTRYLINNIIMTKQVGILIVIETVIVNMDYAPFKLI